MPFGSLLSKAKGSIDLVTADNVKVKIDSNFKKLGLKIIGIPHVEMRSRSRLIFQMYKPQGKELILDAGCGIGIYGMQYALKYPQCDVIGIDFSKDKIKEANKLKESLDIDVNFQIGDITDIDYPDNCVDAIICSEVLEHIEGDGTALKELIRVLKPGGKLILSFPAYTKHSADTQEKFGHARIGYSKEMIERMASKNNLTIEKISGYSYLMGSLAWYLHEKTFVVPILAAILFLPLYLLTFLDILQLEEPNGWVVKLRKR